MSLFGDKKIIELRMPTGKPGTAGGEAIVSFCEGLSADTLGLVVLPQIRGGLVSGGLLAFISSWINVELSIFNTTAALNTIPVKMFNYVQYTIDPSIAAVSAITIVVAALVIIVLDLLIGLDMLSEPRRP